MTSPDQARTPLHFEDLRVGQRFSTAPRIIDQEAIFVFARQFDPQPFHLDPSAATTSLFGGLAASGWHTAALTMRMLVESGPAFAGGLIGAGGEITWPRPTRPGDILHVVSVVEAITPSRSRPERGMVRLRSETINQRGDVAQVLVSNMVVMRRERPEPNV